MEQELQPEPATGTCLSFPCNLGPWAWLGLATHFFPRFLSTTSSRSLPLHPHLPPSYTTPSPPADSSRTTRRSRSRSVFLPLLPPHSSPPGNGKQRIEDTVPRRILFSPINATRPEPHLAISNDRQSSSRLLSLINLGLHEPPRTVTHLLSSTHPDSSPLELAPPASLPLKSSLQDTIAPSSNSPYHQSRPCSPGF